MPDTEEKPVANGLIALVAVAVMVGLLAGIVILVATKVMGVGGSGSGDDVAGGVTATFPDPSKTTGKSGPLVTLPTTEAESEESDDESDKPKKEKTKKEEDQITLSAGATQATPGENLDLSGVYPTGEGSILDIEIRIGDHSWQEFPVDVSVEGSTFTTWVNTSQVGKIQWRVVDKDRNIKSNAVTVTYS